MLLFDQLNPNPNPNDEVCICYYLISSTLTLTLTMKSIYVTIWAQCPAGMQSLTESDAAATLADEVTLNTHYNTC